MKGSRVRSPVAPTHGSQQRGFTLLEVIVALTITGFVLGGLFTLLGGSKRLSWASEESLARAARVRAAVNFAMLENQFLEVEPILQHQRLDIRDGDMLEPPERKTQATLNQLGRFEVYDRERGELFEGTRWILLELPQ
jgi:prepilin-type N-terminal cleavage/methylation domain-containing protein